MRPSLNQITPKDEGVSRISLKLDIIKEAYRSDPEKWRGGEIPEFEGHPCCGTILLSVVIGV